MPGYAIFSSSRYLELLTALGYLRTLVALAACLMLSTHWQCSANLYFSRAGPRIEWLASKSIGVSVTWEYFMIKVTFYLFNFFGWTPLLAAQVVEHRSKNKGSKTAHNTWPPKNKNKIFLLPLSLFLLCPVFSMPELFLKNWPQKTGNFQQQFVPTNNSHQRYSNPCT